MKLTERLILKWAEAHARRFGRWPQSKSPGPIDAPPEWTLTWRSIENALQDGRLGLPRHKSLARFLEKRKPFWFYVARPTQAELRNMIRRHHALTGKWPNKSSGRVIGDIHNRAWNSINGMLVRDSRRAGATLTLADVVAKVRGTPNPSKLPPLTIEQVLKWADEHHQRTGCWPARKKDRHIRSAKEESWRAIDLHLRRGTRGLPAIGGLADLLDQYRNVRNKAAQPPITIKQILAWADENHERTGQWPSVDSGPVHGVTNEKWNLLNAALLYGRRGLRTRTTLARLLVKERGHRHLKELPRLTIPTILRWADAHYAATGDWPTARGGHRVIDHPDEKWLSLDDSLRAGRRGLPGGISLHKLMLRKRKRYGQLRGIPLKRSQILEYSAEHHELTGELPKADSGDVRGQIGENWKAIDAALRVGARSLPGGSSLAELLENHYVPRHPDVGRRLTTDLIWRWVKSFRERVGEWPTRDSAFTDSSRREKWSVIDLALREGYRGLPGRSSLAKLLTQHGAKA